MLPRHLAACALLVLLIAGCGGGGGEAPTANVNLTVNWAARSRSLDAPSSALSVIVMLKKAAANGGDFVYTINRAAEPAAYTKSYTSPTQARVGTWTLSVRFYSLADAQGDVVGTIDAVVNIDKHGKGIANLETIGTIATVSVPGQIVGVGETATLLVIAQDKNGAMIALAPGAEFVKVISGGDKLQVLFDQQIKGVAPGTATVVATVDKITSQPGTVTVAFLPVVTISPELVGVLINGSLHFSATVTSTPDQGIIWSVQEGATGGTITQDGNYVAPGTAGTYHVVATSHFDTTRSAVATVIVNNGNGLGASGIYVADTGNHRIIQMRDITGDSWSAIGTQGSGQYQFNNPNGIHVTPEGKILVADTGNHRIVQMDDITGKNWRTLGTLGTGIGRFQNPRSVSAGADGKIYVADSLNRRLVKIDDITGSGWRSYTNGTGNQTLAVRVAANGKIYLISFGDPGMQELDAVPPTVVRQNGIAIGYGFDFDSQAHLYIATGGAYIIRFDSFDSKFAVELNGINGPPFQFNTAYDLKVGPDNRIYVADGSKIVRIDDFTGTNWRNLGATPGNGIGQFSGAAGIYVR